jgi:hypothetical protein
MNGAVARFAADLLDAGVATRERAVLALLYDRALLTGSATAWTRFYRALFTALRPLAHEPPASVSTATAIESLLRIVEDDLGARLFDADELRRLRGRLPKRHLDKLLAVAAS